MWQGFERLFEGAPADRVSAGLSADWDGGGSAVIERELNGEQAQAFFDDLWRPGGLWGRECSRFSQAIHARELALLGKRRYQRALEVGCGAGFFTRLVAGLADRTVALDLSEVAIARARAAGAPGPVDYRVANVMEYDPVAEGPWDLVVLNETVYYLGWLYSFFEVGWLASQLFEATRSGGHLLMANTFSLCQGSLYRTWLIRTYRDLFRNTGYRLEAEEVARGREDETNFKVLISLFTKDPRRSRAKAPGPRRRPPEGGRA
jgi:SAM-dependent methyltransferase